MASKGVIIGAVAIVAIIAVAGAAFMFMGDEDPKDPVDPPEVVLKGLEFKDPQVGMKTTYDVFFSAKFCSILTLPNAQYDIFGVVSEGEMAEYTYEDLTMIVGMFAEGGDALLELIGIEDAKSMGMENIIISASGTILSDPTTIKPKEEIKIGDTLYMDMRAIVTMEITKVTSTDVTYTLMGETETEPLSNLTDNSSYGTKTDTVTVDSVWGKMPCDVYVDPSDATVTLVSGYVWYEKSSSSGVLETMKLTLKSSDMIEVVDL